MARRQTRQRIYWRERGGVRRAYADFRDFSDVGGKREALIPRGQTVAASDPVIAEKLVADRLQQLQEHRRNKTLLGVERQASLQQFASYHLVEKAKSGRVTERWLYEAENQLKSAVKFFGADRDLAAVSVSDVQKYLSDLLARPSGRGGTLGKGTARHYLNSLSNLYRRAASEGYVPPGYNPVAALIDKPTAKRHEAKWLEVHEAALLLESARTYKPKRGDIALPIYPLVATFLLTGGRRSEVLGLAADDVSFDRKTVTFRPNGFRRLKTSTSHRTVPLWPQLEEILRAYVFDPDVPHGELLFPSPKLTGEELITDTRRALDAIGKRAGWKAGEIRTKMFRHTYCAARLQTLDRGAPVSPWTVAKEMGHGGRSLVDRVYGHLGEVRHRAELVEYRIEQHSAQVRERLEALSGL